MSSLCMRILNSINTPWRNYIRSGRQGCNPGNPALDIVIYYLETFDENANDGCYFPLLKKIKSNRWKHDSFDKSKSL